MAHDSKWLKFLRQIPLAIFLIIMSTSSSHAEMRWSEYFSSLLDETESAKIDVEIGYIQKDYTHGLLVPLADPLNHRAILNKKILLQPGTTVFLYKRFKDNRKKRSQLALTPYGTFVYLPRAAFKPGWYKETSKTGEDDSNSSVEELEIKIQLIRRAEIVISKRLSAILETGLILPAITKGNKSGDYPEHWIVRLNSNVAPNYLKKDFSETYPIPLASAQIVGVDTKKNYGQSFYSRVCGRSVGHK